MAIETTGFLDEFFAERCIASDFAGLRRRAAQQEGGDGFCFGRAEFEVRHGVAGKMRLRILEISEERAGKEFFRNVIEGDAICCRGLAWEGVTGAAVEIVDESRAGFVRGAGSIVSPNS